MSDYESLNIEISNGTPAYEESISFYVHNHDLPDKALEKLLKHYEVSINQYGEWSHIICLKSDVYNPINSLIDLIKCTKTRMNMFHKLKKKYRLNAKNISLSFSHPIHGWFSIKTVRKQKSFNSRVKGRVTFQQIQ
jgi:hypothetical protein